MMGKLRIIKIYEDRPNKLTLTDDEKKDILLLGDIIGDKNVILQTDGRLTVKHYVGFIQVNKTRLLIYPKISIRSQGEDKYDEAFRILLKLLSYTGFISVKRIPSSQNLGRYKGDLLELFIGIFTDELLFQFKRDMSKAYNENIENQSFIKGKINFSQTIRKNIFKKHLHYVNYHEFTSNILLNQIFKSMIKNLITRTQVKENKAKLREALLWLNEIESIGLTNEIWDKVRFTRLNRHYEPVFNLGKLFYYNFNPNLNTGEYNTFSFLVPLNRLFEDYLYKVLKNSERDGELVTSQGPIDYLGKSRSGEKQMRLIPDISIIKDGNVKWLLDAKYKDSSLLQSDIYQMLAYGIRYGCNNIAILYPMYLENDSDEMLFEEIKIENNEESLIIRAIKVDLAINPEDLGKKLTSLMLESANV